MTHINYIFKILENVGKQDWINIFQNYEHQSEIKDFSKA